MKADYIAYTKYVVRHKWYVFLECCKLGIPLRGILHDLSKFLPSEFFPYAIYFNGKEQKGENSFAKAGYKKPKNTSDDFDLAWLLHQKRNKHHWQWWVLLEDEGSPDALEMPLKYAKEMIADWKGAGRAQGNPDNCKTWYLKNRNKMTLAAYTRFWVETTLGVAKAEFTEPLYPKSLSEITQKEGIA